MDSTEKLTKDGIMTSEGTVMALSDASYDEKELDHPSGMAWFSHNAWRAQGPRTMQSQACPAWGGAADQTLATCMRR